MDINVVVWWNLRGKKEEKKFEKQRSMWVLFHVQECNDRVVTGREVFQLKETCIKDNVLLFPLVT
jgi:hypothetical protein